MEPAYIQYTESRGIVFQFNRFGPLCDDCSGNNLKDRSSGAVIRYNYIEGGNRQLDLVESGHDNQLEDPNYRATHVYGNILIEPDGAGNTTLMRLSSNDESAVVFNNLLFVTQAVSRQSIRAAPGKRFASRRCHTRYRSL